VSCTTPVVNAAQAAAEQLRTATFIVQQVIHRLSMCVREEAAAAHTMATRCR
jgi:hypothetical protein